MAFRRPRGGKPDANQQDIVDGLREHGASVTIISAVGHGCPDLLVGCFDARTSEARTFVLEVKAPGKKQNRKEVDWALTWRGQYAVVETVEQALKAVGWDV